MFPTSNDRIYWEYTPSKEKTKTRFLSFFGISLFILYLVNAIWIAQSGFSPPMMVWLVVSFPGLPILFFFLFGQVVKCVYGGEDDDPESKH